MQTIMNKGEERMSTRIGILKMHLHLSKEKK